MKDGKKLAASTKEADNELQLWEHTVDGKTEYEMVINGVFIMATYNFLSSELLVRNTVKDMIAADKKILIGGLGFGFSLREACRHGKKIKEIYVVEYSPAVIEWNHTYLHDLNGRYLESRKVHVIRDDFISYVMDTEVKFDAICMDIDNGPMLLIHEENSRAYTTGFFSRIKEILNTDGLFSVWSGNKDPQLYDDIVRVFGNCTMEEAIENHFGKDVTYYLYTGKYR